jgi:hypothetical protein
MIIRFALAMLERDRRSGVAEGWSPHQYFVLNTSMRSSSILHPTTNNTFSSQHDLRHHLLLIDMQLYNGSELANFKTSSGDSY